MLYLALFQFVYLKIAINHNDDKFCKNTKMAISITKILYLLAKIALEDCKNQVFRTKMIIQVGEVLRLKKKKGLS